MTQGNPSGKPENTTQLPSHLSHEKKTCHLYHLDGHEGTKTIQGATPQKPIQLQGLGEKKGNCSHLPPKTSMANITAHVLLSGDGEKMKIDHPTNDPRPLFKQTQKNNSIFQPTFHTKIRPRNQDEHGQQYCSCATEWGWRVDENQPSYK